MSFSAFIKDVSVRKAVPFLGASFGLLLFCIPVFSQLNYGRIYGAIADQGGGVIVGATVTVIDVDRGLPRPLVADSAGEYSAPSLLAGKYTVRSRGKGLQDS